MFKTALMVCLLALATPASAQDGPYYRPAVVLQLGVSNLDKAIDFYERVLGFKTVERRDDLQFAHIETNVPGLQFGLSVGSKLHGTGAAIVNISVADVAAARKVLESRGVVFTGPTQVIPGKVALAGFRDPDGNHLRLAGPPLGNNTRSGERNYRRSGDQENKRSTKLCSSP